MLLFCPWRWVICSLLFNTLHETFSFSIGACMFWGLTVVMESLCDGKLSKFIRVKRRCIVTFELEPWCSMCCKHGFELVHWRLCCWVCFCYFWVSYPFVYSYHFVLYIRVRPLKVYSFDVPWFLWNVCNLTWFLLVLFSGQLVLIVLANDLVYRAVDWG